MSNVLSTFPRTVPSRLEPRLSVLDFASWNMRVKRGALKTKKH